MEEGGELDQLTQSFQMVNRGNIAQHPEHLGFRKDQVVKPARAAEYGDGSGAG